MDDPPIVILLLGRQVICQGFAMPAICVRQILAGIVIFT